MKEHRVSAEEAGMPLLSFLRKKNPEAPSVKSLKRAIDGKCCIVNGQIETFSSHPLRKNDRVLLRKREEKRHVLTPLYEDDDLLIVDKPPGLTCEDRFFTPLLPTRAQLIHRLDKETSGLVLLGKNRAIVDAMIALFRVKGIHKEYLAIVDGKMREPKGIIQNFLRKKASQPGQAVYIASRNGIEAITRYRCLKEGKDASLVLCEPITGRTHQIRVHMNGLGHPILGDTHYGQSFGCTLHPQRHLLHAQALSFIHPLSEQKVHIISPPPVDFEEACYQLHLNR